jgi:hypothetical protein
MARVHDSNPRGLRRCARAALRLYPAPIPDVSKVDVLREHETIPLPAPVHETNVMRHLSLAGKENSTR